MFRKRARKPEPLQAVMAVMALVCFAIFHGSQRPADTCRTVQSP